MRTKPQRDCLLQSDYCAYKMTENCYECQKSQVTFRYPRHPLGCLCLQQGVNIAKLCSSMCNVATCHHGLFIPFFSSKKKWKPLISLSPWRPTHKFRAEGWFSLNNYSKHLPISHCALNVNYIKSFLAQFSYSYSASLTHNWLQQLIHQSNEILMC